MSICRQWNVDDRGISFTEQLREFRDEVDPVDLTTTPHRQMNRTGPVLGRLTDPTMD